MDDIEDIIDNKLTNLVLKLCENQYKNDKDFNNELKRLRRIYKLCPSINDIREEYETLLKQKKVTINLYLQNKKKKGVRSNSGVAVITILTSPFPEYTLDGKKIQIGFSCGKDCHYCPNEAEIKLNLTVIDCNDKIINVKTNDSLKVIRVISYIIFKDKQFEVIESNKFTENTFEMKLKDDIKFEPGDNFIGVKIAQPRSYLSTEPAVLRANKNNFDSVEQCWDRAYTLQRCGHPVDKIEIIVLGGTWSHYPKEYQREFIRDTYYAMNTFPEHLKILLKKV